MDNAGRQEEGGLRGAENSAGRGEPAVPVRGREELRGARSGFCLRFAARVVLHGSRNGGFLARFLAGYS